MANRINRLPNVPFRHTTRSPRRACAVPLPAHVGGAADLNRTRAEATLLLEGGDELSKDVRIGLFGAAARNDRTTKARGQRAAQRACATDGNASVQPTALSCADTAAQIPGEEYLRVAVLCSALKTS